MNSTLTDDGTVKVAVPSSPAGDLEFTIGAEGSEFVRVTSDNFTWRGRQYTGVIMLQRASLHAAPGYAWMLKDYRGATASQRVHEQLVRTIRSIVLQCLKNHPEVLADASRAGLVAAIEAKDKQIGELAGQLESAQSGRDRLLAELDALEEVSPGA